MKTKKQAAVVLAALTAAGVLAGCKKEAANGDVSPYFANLVLSYDFNEESGNMAYDSVVGGGYKIDYVFNAENQDKLFKESSDPLRKAGAEGNALYMDGFSTYVTNRTFSAPKKAVTLSAWVAPRVFENLPSYADDSPAAGNPRLTSVINKGSVDDGEGFLLGYGRLGMWGVQLALESRETGETFVAAFYDPLNALPLYEWSNIAVSFNGAEGYIALFFNGETAYEVVIPELQNTRIISTEKPLYVGKYCSPVYEFGVERQMISGLLDAVKIYDAALTPAEAKAEYKDVARNGHPVLEFSEIALDSSVYAGDRYRPQYHALPPAVWMNEPHSPFYYKGKYHVMYQHNPAGPYWSQIRWGHLVSDDMIHWQYVKDAVVPTAGICPEGVWTGGACIGPDGTPWLAVTAGTNTSAWSGQNVAFAHAKDPDDVYLTEWVVEDTVVLTQPGDDSQGERDQFRDPFVWRDGDTYYMMISTSVPGRGGSANIYVSENMREWEYKGYVFECDFAKYPEQGAHWECVVMLPISKKDGSETKYILFDCPQYTVDGYVVDCYYWIGRFDKTACRFIPDNEKPQLFDCGGGVYTGQNGYCFLTDEDAAAGKTAYESGRTVIYAIAQGKDAGTEQNKWAGWAHNFAMPLQLWLSDDGAQVIREPVREIQSLYGETLYEVSDAALSAADVNGYIKNIRGDMLRIDMKFTLSPTADTYESGLYVRYNPVENDKGTERTKIAFAERGVYIDREKSSLLDYVSKKESYLWGSVEREYSVTVLLDRSMLEMYVNGVMSFTTRIYPKYGNSDYLRLFDENGGMTVTEMTVRAMKGAFTKDVVPAYYGNVGNLS
ncbi:MAG: GH32 C-terminal domain-containing protein [Candidatus Scatosoma sp.]